ncbi:MAG: HPF/RaiA family ribosome-associated protein [Alphaproteobacteria bacterium]|nr:HPF/RaiA family ribosome-associated protein [Alphaproteobacteria bacterium]
MDVPLEITFEGVDHSDAAEEFIREQVSKLEKFFDHVIACRVVLDRPHHSHTKGDQYEVRIFIDLPGKKDVAVTNHPGNDFRHDDPYVTIRDAFKAAEKQLKKAVDEIRGNVKSH